ncbi:DUF2149 domain-containing protein [Leucobacter weissii]|uniref:DUF2149 domain-containing protein n=1 Tax=Leucobacter weissii TaxID=1983706 RepID=A0A939S5U1_9MICO|nr:DUF2149 domain-containing protein [Leucobacter weissii]MBO1901674.1 DUF2149 domain-containing protein [Leucobacter weissii]
MSRIRLGRHSQGDTDAGDPLDSMVNMFDVGLVLAVAFLVAGLSVASAASPADSAAPSEEQTEITIPDDTSEVSGEGTSVGEVYQLDDGTLVIVTPEGEGE